jgi:hypothetical protein
MGTSPRRLTVDQAAKRLGLSRRTVIELIGDGRLTWTMAADKTTVIVEMPTDLDQFVRQIGGSVKLQGAHQPSPIRTPGSSSQKRRRHGDGPTISDLDAWSQPK